MNVECQINARNAKLNKVKLMIWGHARQVTTYNGDPSSGYTCTLTTAIALRTYGKHGSFMSTQEMAQQNNIQSLWSRYACHIDSSAKTYLPQMEQ